MYLSQMEHKLNEEILVKTDTDAKKRWINQTDINLKPVKEEKEKSCCACTGR